MSNTEKTEISDLRRYMEHSLAEHYTQVITFKDREDSFVSLYIEGRTLDKILDSGQLTSAQAAAYTIDLCHALEELHNLGIVHRDIKPANVMITPENRAVLLDLSIAREISSDQQDTRSLGTVGYAAPEQYGVAQSNRATDLYALGVLLNTMITGVHPAVDIPRGPIRHIVQKATDTQISKRYKSAAAMARALRPYVRL